MGEHGRILQRRLRELREQRGYTQTELGDLAGLSRKTVNQIECGERGGSLEVVCSIARALGVRVDVLLSEAGRSPAANPEDAVPGPSPVHQRVAALLRAWPEDEVEILEKLLKTWKTARGTPRPPRRR